MIKGKAWIELNPIISENPMDEVKIKNQKNEMQEWKCLSKVHIFGYKKRYFSSREFAVELNVPLAVVRKWRLSGNGILGFEQWFLILVVKSKIIWFYMNSSLNFKLFKMLGVRVLVTNSLLRLCFDLLLPIFIQKQLRIRKSCMNIINV